MLGAFIEGYDAMRMGLTTVIVCASALAGCASLQHKPRLATATVPPDLPRTWQALITPADRTLLDGIGATWTQALGAVPKRSASRVAGEGPLTVPDGALEHPVLPPGPYYCRLIRFGGAAGVATFKPDFCIVGGSGNAVSFTKQGGTNLFGGWLFADTDRRQVFLGSSRPRAGRAGPAYGTDATRDVAGVVERVSPFRWRLSLTRAGGGAMLDVYELVPVTPKVPGAVPAVPG